MEDGHILAQQTGFVNPFLKKSFHHAAACAPVGDMQDGAQWKGKILPFCICARRDKSEFTISARSALGSPSGRAVAANAVTERAVPAATEDSPCHCVALPPHKCGGQGLSFRGTFHPGDSHAGDFAASEWHCCSECTPQCPAKFRFIPPIQSGSQPWMSSRSSTCWPLAVRLRLPLIG